MADGIFNRRTGHDSKRNDVHGQEQLAVVVQLTEWPCCLSVYSQVGGSTPSQVNLLTGVVRRLLVDSPLGWSVDTIQSPSELSQIVASLDSAIDSDLRSDTRTTSESVLRIFLARLRARDGAT